MGGRSSVDASVTIAAFYKNEIESTPDGDFIETMLREWYGNYDRLEYHHGFVQWLFPTRTFSQFNMLAPKLTDADIATMKSDVVIGKRLIRAYRLILDFYGMNLVSEMTGEVERSSNYKKRYHETLETREHNHLRVCRILSCFSVLGFRRYKLPLVRFLEAESGFSDGAVKRNAGSWPLKISARTIGMFRTYIDEGSASYVQYSGVVLPGDHTDHVLFSAPAGIVDGTRAAEVGITADGSSMDDVDAAAAVPDEAEAAEPSAPSSPAEVVTKKARSSLEEAEPEVDSASAIALPTLAFSASSDTTDELVPESTAASLDRSLPAPASDTTHDKSGSSDS